MSDDSGKNETTRRTFMVGGAAAAIGAAAVGRTRPDKVTDEQASELRRQLAVGDGPTRCATNAESINRSMAKVMTGRDTPR